MVLNIFLKKLKNLSEIKTQKQIFFDYKEMCGYFSIEFIDFMLAGKKLTDYANLFSSHDFKKNDNIILSYFKNE